MGSFSQRIYAASAVIMHILSTVAGTDHLIMWWDDMGNIDHHVTCGEYTCQVTVNRARMTEDKSMAFIFDGTSFGETGFPYPRISSHIWGLFMNESPKNNEWLMCQEEVISLFNFTTTFQRQSHVPFPTQWLNSLDDLTDVTYLVRTSEKTRLRTELGLAPIIFVHTDCQTPSQRERYMQMLEKYVPIDSYGPCLHNKDFTNSTILNSLDGMLSPELFNLVAKYKFAFAFENAVCSDYITEKLWRPLQAGSVPIVFGSPLIKDFLPSEQSAIVVTDLNDIQEVANLIKAMDENDDLYDKYLQFKKMRIDNPTLIEYSKKLNGHGDIFTNFECFLCKELHASGQEKHTPSAFRCPRPLSFDGHGHYVLHSENIGSVYENARYRAKALKYFHDRNINATGDEISQHTNFILNSAETDEKTIL